ncbi:MAG: hypothetical protein R2695_16615 [Acidimicrobiales bacterium]
MQRRSFLIGASGFAALTACSGSGGQPAAGPGTSALGTTSPTSSTSSSMPPVDRGLPAPGTAGLVDEAYYQARVDEYLTYAAADPRLGSASGVGVQLAMARRDPDYVWAVDDVTVDGFAERWTQIDEWRDTRDFQFMYLNWLLVHGQGDTATTRLGADFIAAVSQRVIDNRYRYDDPLPDDRIDHLWYWSENHRIITLANEFLAGQFFPDETFTVTGMTGAEHATRARPDILDWIHERARFGFFEWHSNVYMAKNITPLLMLVELADDDEIVQAAARPGSLPRRHGRPLPPWRVRGSARAHVQEGQDDRRDEDTFDVAKLLFDRTPGDFRSPDSTTATYFCLAERYRPPQLVIDIAHDETVTVTRERHGIHVDPQEPISDTPEAPFGYDFKDPKNLPFWWSTGGSACGRSPR